MFLDERKIGIEIEVESESVAMHRASQALAFDGSVWEVVEEGSLRAGGLGWEVRTSGGIGRPYREVRAGLSQLYPLLANSTGTWRSAVHVHVSIEGHMTHYNGGYAALLAACFCADEYLFDTYSPERRESNFCAPLSHDLARTVSALRRFKDGIGIPPSEWCKYTSVNLLPMSTIGTVEFRHMRTPAVPSDVRGTERALNSIWDYAHRCASIVHAVNSYCAQVTARQVDIEDMLLDQSFALRAGVTLNPEAIYHVTQALHRPTLTSVDLDLPSLYKAGEMPDVPVQLPRRESRRSRERAVLSGEFIDMALASPSEVEVFLEQLSEVH